MFIYKKKKRACGVLTITGTEYSLERDFNLQFASWDKDTLFSLPALKDIIQTKVLRTTGMEEAYDFFFFPPPFPNLLENPIDDKVQAESVDGTTRDWSEINCVWKVQKLFQRRKSHFRQLWFGRISSDMRNFVEERVWGP